MTGAPRHWEDFAPGERFSSPSHRVEAADIIAFATEFDPQPQHIDPQAAARGRFEGLIASGWHTASVTMRLLMTGGLPPVIGGTVGAGVESLAWPQPVRPGDVLTVTTEILETRPSRSRPEYGLVRFRAVTRNQAGGTVQDMTSTLIAPRRTGGGARRACG